MRNQQSQCICPTPDFCQDRPFGNLVLFQIPFYLRLNFELELNETQAMVFECMYESSPKSPERMRPLNSMKGFSAFQPPTRIHRSREPLSCSVQTQTTMAALVLALILFPLLSSATEQGHQALCGRVDGQAAPEDVQALLHHTLPLALPWDQAWLGSLQVPFYSAFNTCKILNRPEQAVVGLPLDPLVLHSCVQADHPGDLLQLFTYWAELSHSSFLAPWLPSAHDVRLMALALLRLQDVYNLPTCQVFLRVG